MFQSVRTFPVTEVVVIGAVSLTVIAAGIFVVLRIRRKPKDKEKLRRLEVNLNGRLGDATITDITDDAIFYEYSVGGLTYTASQDISQLRELIPADSHRLIGRPASLKYSTQNPANSILLCEEWSRAARHWAGASAELVADGRMVSVTLNRASAAVTRLSRGVCRNFSLAASVYNLRGDANGFRQNGGGDQHDADDRYPAGAADHVHAACQTAPKDCRRKCRSRRPRVSRRSPIGWTSCCAFARIGPSTSTRSRPHARTRRTPQVAIRDTARRRSLHRGRPRTGVCRRGVRHRYRARSRLESGWIADGKVQGREWYSWQT